jgi:hypothetical protein
LDTFSGELCVFTLITFDGRPSNIKWFTEIKSTVNKCKQYDCETEEEIVYCKASRPTSSSAYMYSVQL